MVFDYWGFLRDNLDNFERLIPVFRAEGCTYPSCENMPYSDRKNIKATMFGEKISLCFLEISPDGGPISVTSLFDKNLESFYLLANMSGTIKKTKVKLQDLEKLKRRYPELRNIEEMQEIYEAEETYNWLVSLQKHLPESNSKKTVFLDPEDYRKAINLWKFPSRPFIEKICPGELLIPNPEIEEIQSIGILGLNSEQSQEDNILYRTMETLVLEKEIGKQIWLRELEEFSPHSR